MNMKKIFFATALLAFAASGFAQTAGYKINGKVSDSSLEGKMIYLQEFSQVLDSAKVENALSKRW